MRKYSILLLLSFMSGLASLAQEGSAWDGSPRVSNLSPALKINHNYAIKAQQIDRLMQTLYNQNQFNGTILIMEKGAVIYQKALGWSNYENRDTLSLRTPFRLASVSKQFTAMAIMMLMEEGKLNYDDPINKHLPGLPYSNVSIRNLLHHNSGIPDYFGIGWSIQKYFTPGKLITNDDILTYFKVKKPKLGFKPGSKASYSNTGYVFLASIVEKLSGKPFGQFLEDRIFKPLGMKDSYVYNTQNYLTTQTRDTVLTRSDTVYIGARDIEINTDFRVVTRVKTELRDRAIGYDLSHPYPAAYKRFDFHAFDGIAGEKSVCASALDLVIWDKALKENQLVKKETMAEAYKPSGVSDKKVYGYGFGWKIYEHNPNIVFHHGLYRGFRNYFHRDLEQDRTIIILSNRRLGGKVTQIYYRIDDILHGKKISIPKISKQEKKTFPAFKNKFWIDYSG